MNDADLWEYYVKNGVTKDVATSLVEQKVHTLPKADAWEAYVRSGIKKDYAERFTKKMSAPKTTAAEAFGNHLANAGTFGFAPKIVAAVSSLKNEGNLSQYDAKLAEIRGTLDQTRQDHPKVSLASELIGGLWAPGMGAAGLARTAGVGAKAVAGAKAGATYGALSGVGHADGGVVDHVVGAAGGAVGGAVAGGVVGGVMGGASRMIRGKPNPDLRRVAPALKAAGTSPEELAANPPDMLADRVPDLTRTVRSVSSEARQTIDKALRDRQKEQLPSVADALERGLNVKRGSMRQSIRDVVTKQEADAAELYEKAYAAPPINDPFVDKVRQLPRFREAYNAGNKIELAKIDGSPVPPLPAEGPLPPLDIRALDIMKRGLDDVIENGFKGGTISRGEARELRITMRELLKKADELRPAYGEARAAFAGQARLLDAAKAGHEMLSPPGMHGPKATAEDIAEHISGLDSAGERELFKRGAIEALMSQVESARGSATGGKDIVASVYSSVGGRAKVRALFDSDTAADAFDRRMEDIAEQTGVSKFVMGGSQTADKEAGKAAFSRGDNVRKLNALRYPWQATISALSHLGGKAFDASDVNAATDLAPHLVARGPKLQELIEALNRAPRGSAQEAQLLRAISGSVGNKTGGLFGSLTR